MTIKQKINYLVAGTGVIFSALITPLLVVVPAQAAATSCGGVATSVIACGQKGQCTSDPNEGTDPGTDQTAISAYIKKYGHEYGKSQDPYEGKNPVKSKDQTAAEEKKAVADYVATYGHDYGECRNSDGSESTPAKGVESTGLWGILLLVINILTAGIGILAVAGIVYGSILYTSAGGSADQVKKARTAITNVVIGIVAYALMYTLLNFIIPGGLFKP